MTVSAAVYDNQTKDKLPGASVLVVNSNGVQIGGGLQADNNGFFSITDPALDTGGKLLISYVGYTSAIVDPSTANAAGAIGLDPNADELTAAVVTPASNKPASTNLMPLLAVAGGALLLASSGRKKKKTVSGTGGEATTVLVVGGVAVGAYFLILKPLLQSLGLLPNPQQAATTDAQKTALQQAITTAQQTGQTGATYTADQYTGWANDIYAQATQTSSVPIPTANQDAIVTDVINVNTMVDLQSLISAFGQRKAQCLIWGIDCNTYDLPAFLKLALDTIHINKINGYLDDQNINYQF